MKTSSLEQKTECPLVVEDWSSVTRSQHDSGIYICKAVNGFGSIHVALELKVVLGRMCMTKM